MTRRLALRSSIALLLVVGTSASYGAATQTVAELRATSCCAHDCGHDPAKPADPTRCCGVAPANTAVASAAPAMPSVAPSLVVALPTPASPPVPPRHTARGDDLAAARAAPIFLLTRSLRI